MKPKSYAAAVAGVPELNDALNGLAVMTGLFLLIR